MNWDRCWDNCLNGVCFNDCGMNSWWIYWFLCYYCDNSFVREYDCCWFMWLAYNWWWLSYNCGMNWWWDWWSSSLSVCICTWIGNSCCLNTSIVVVIHNCGIRLGWWIGLIGCYLCWYLIGGPCTVIWIINGVCSVINTCPWWIEILFRCWCTPVDGIGINILSICQVHNFTMLNIPLSDLVIWVVEIKVWSNKIGLTWWSWYFILIFVSKLDQFKCLWE